MYKIEKNIKLVKLTVGKPVKYPFSEMEVGDSFAIPADEVKRLRGAGSVYGRKHNIKFSIRMTENGHRIWRIK